MAALSFLACFSAGLALLLSPLAPMQLLWLFQASIVPIIVVSKVRSISRTLSLSLVFSSLFIPFKTTEWNRAVKRAERSRLASTRSVSLVVMKNNTSESHTTTKVPGLCLNGGWEEEEDGVRKQNGRFHFHSVLVRRETRRGGGRLTGGPNVPTSRDICSPRNGHQKDKSLFHRGPPAGLFRDLSAPFLMSVVHQPVPPVLPSLLCIHSLYARGRRRDSDEMQKPSYPVAVGVHFWKWGEVKHPFVMGGPRTAFKRCGRSATTSVVLCYVFVFSRARTRSRTET